MKLEVGLLYRGTVRRFLEEAKWHGQLTEYKEIKTWFDSTFLLKGVTPNLARQIDRWVRDVSLDD